MAHGEVRLVGLGPGRPDQVPPSHWEQLETAACRFVTTARHPLCRRMLASGLSFTDLEEELARAQTPEEAAATVTERIMAAVGHGPVAVGVPGHPLYDHLPTNLLVRRLEEAGLAVTVYGAAGNIEPLCGLLGLADEAWTLHRGDRLQPHDLNPGIGHIIRPLSGGRIVDRLAAAVSARYPADHVVIAVRCPGGDEPQIVHLPAHRLASAEGVRAPHGDPLTWYYVAPVQPHAADLRRGRAEPQAAPAFAGRCRHPLDPLVDVMARLRGPGGCPWDREQDHLSLRPYLIEEAYEAIDAIEAGDTAKLVEELGDVLLQVVFHSQLGAESGRFTVDDVVRTVTEKMIRRHPHVFGDVEAADSAAVLRNWEAIKQGESADEKQPPSLLAGIPRHLPALVEAETVQSRAARIGFQWPNVEGAIAKVREEWREWRQAYRKKDAQRIVQEWGDLLFALVNVARYLDINSELALRESSRKFRQRFTVMEQRARELGRDLRELTLDELDALWEEAKAAEQRGG